MANLKAFALNIAKQIKPDDSIECIAEIIEQQIESVRPMTHQPTVGTGQRETLVAPIECLIAYHEKEAKDHVSSQWIYGNHMMAVQAYKKVLKMIAALAAHEEGGGTDMERCSDCGYRPKLIAPDGKHLCGWDAVVGYRLAADTVNTFRKALEEIIAVASGERQVANDDTEGIAWIDKRARTALASQEPRP